MQWSRRYFPYLVIVALLAAAVISRDLNGLWWHLGAIAAAYALMMVGKNPSNYRTVGMIVLTYTAVQAVTTILVQVDLIGWPGAVQYQRVQLGYPNPNLLGAALTVSTIAGLHFLRSCSWLVSLLFTILSGLAVFATGSRTAMIALFVGVLIHTIINHMLSFSRAKRPAWAIVAVLGTTVILLALLLQPSDSTTNLLRSSSFRSPHWIIPESTRFHIDMWPSWGPSRFTLAEHLTAKTGESTRIIVYQGAEISRPGQPYVASVWLRSHTPDTVVLNTQLSRVECKVSSTWQRCITPVGYGDGRARAQFRLETTSFSESVDIYVWAPQIEPSATVGVSTVNRPALISNATRDRFRGDVLGVGAPRWKGMQTAWRLFIESPFVGHGRDSSRFSEYFIHIYPEEAPVHHAHNAVLNLLYTSGVLGTFAWVGTLLIGVLAIPGSARVHAVALLATLALLNIADDSFFHVGSFYCTWLTLGALGSNDYGHSDHQLLKSASRVVAP